MTEFDKFLKVNSLKKIEIAMYLGCSNAFVTQLCNGQKYLSDDKIALIKANTNWQTDMLKTKNELKIEQGNPEDNPKMDDMQMDYNALIQSLIDRIKSLEDQIDWMQGIIDKLTDK